MVPAHLSLITLGVDDVARATSFYQRLGWPLLEMSDPEVSFLQLSVVVLALFPRPLLAADAMVDDRASGFPGVTMSINLPTQAEVDQAAEAWVAAGGTLVKRPQSAEWGGYSGYVSDLDGHLWELAYNPYSPEWAAPTS